MLSKTIIIFGKKQTAACDGKCDKAWGVDRRPKELLSDDPDDVVYLADDELPTAPMNPGSYEGGFGKPTDPADRLNKWCVRQCERAARADGKAKALLPDYSRRRYNFAARQVMADLELPHS